MRNTVDFFLHRWLNIDSLISRERFADHSRETFSAVLDTSEQIAADKYAPFNRDVDTTEPRTEINDDGTLRVVLPRATHEAFAAYAGSGLLAAAQDYEMGGMQLPYTVELAANSIFSKASVSISWAMLTTGNANLLMAHGTSMQREVFAKNQFAGRWMGTMCLSEPQAGSSLSDITTRAVLDDDSDPLGPRYRLTGNKMWISGGEHEITENIIHLVLAKIPDEHGKLIAGTKGISLFVVPKFLVSSPFKGEAGRGMGFDVSHDSDSRENHPHPRPPLEGEGAEKAAPHEREGWNVSERNDVVLAGLNHKLGWRGTTNCLLNFGEGKFKPLGKAGAVGYLVGKPGDGLRCMFHMMNEARIGVGTAATMLGMAGYEASLQYAKDRKQGRPIQAATVATVHGSTGSPRTDTQRTEVPRTDALRTEVRKAADQPQVPLIEHADVKRMLLAQKAYCEGALALELYCARLVDESHTGEPDAVADAKLLLEVLTPIAKSWPSEWCLEANSLAIQIHGGYGYTRDFPVEQYWRDNRLNMIHEGAHGIQALDLLGRKVVMDGGKGLMLLAHRMNETIQKAMHTPTGQHTPNGPHTPKGPHTPSLAEHAQTLARALQHVGQATKSAWSTGNPTEALANATPYLQAFGHMTIAWIWLDVMLAFAAENHPHPRPPLEGEGAFLEGKRAACQYFFNYELPKIDAWLNVVKSRDMTCANVSIDAF